MIKVGVIGIGTMGLTHLDVYHKLSNAKVIAVADLIEEKRNGKKKSVGNVEGQAQGGFDFSKVKQYDEGMKLIADPEVELVDICLQTHQHVEFGIAALKAGKHLIVEKPLGRDSKDALKLVAAAAKSKKFAMPAQCMRFWPGWTDLKEAIDKKTYGKVLSASFRRVASHPGGEFYFDGNKCGGALLDLHVHDIDFVQFLFGMPKGVISRGYKKHTNAIDHVVTQYVYDKIPIVMAEGGWAMQKGFGFNMQYTVNFEKGTLVFDLGAANKLMLYKEGQPPQPVQIDSAMGYENEIKYLLNCIETKKKPKTVTLKDAANSVKIADAEVKSIAGGGKFVKV